MAIEAYPLNWPPGKARKQWPEESRFRTTLGAAIKEVQAEVSRLGGRSLVISSNLPLRRDGIPYANASQPNDRGVAVYFEYKKKPMCFACDRWKKVEDNMWAIAKTIDALRGIWCEKHWQEQLWIHGWYARPASRSTPPGEQT